MSKFYTFCDKMGSKIYHRYVEDGKRKQVAFQDYPFELFIKGDKHDSASLLGDQLSRVKFTSCSDMTQFVKEYSGVTDIYGQTSPAHQFIAKKYPGKIDFDINQFVILSFDIEVEHSEGFAEPKYANNEILTISMKVFNQDKKITLGLKPYTPKTGDEYHQCHDEKELIVKFLDIWKRINPDIITGWNTNGYDIPYLVNRIDIVLGRDITVQLSPFHKDTKHVFQEIYLNADVTSYRILGIVSYDYNELYKKFAREKLESYKLDFVADHELGVGKVDLSPWGNSLMRLYNEDFNTFIHYNEVDVELIEKLDQRLNFIQLTVSIVMMTHSRFHEALKTVKPWDNMVYNMLLERNIQVPPESYTREGEDIVGGFVKPPTPGLYKWIVSMDLTSLYPSIIRMFNMSPETIVAPANNNQTSTMEAMLRMELNLDKSRSQGLATAANGSMYTQTKEGILPHAMSYVFNERKKVKNEMLELKKSTEALKVELSKLEENEIQTR